MPALTPEQIKRRIEERVKSASAKATATDPTEKGGASIPVDPKASKTEQNLPPDKTNTSSEGKKLEDKDTKPTSTGKNVPAAKDGEAADQVTKVASDRISAIKGRLATLHKGDTTKVATQTTNTKSATEAPKQEVVELDQDAMLKLASTIVATEEGMDVVLPLLRRQVGRERAAEMIKAASEEYNQAVENFYLEQEFYKYAAAEEAARQEYIESVFSAVETPEEAERLIKTAAAHDLNTQYLQEWEKLAYAQGPEDAAAMLEAEEAGGEAALPGAEEPTIEQILMLLEAAVANGEIDEETAVALAEELLGGAEGGEMDEEEVVKEASTSLVNDVKSLYQKFNAKA